MDKLSIKEFLDEKVALYNHPKFIETDPILIPHLFSLKEDIEIAAFLIATIAWGNRKSIITNGHRLMELMGNTPYNFVMEFSDKDSEFLTGFVHRTFNGDDLKFFIRALQNIYKNHGGLERVFVDGRTKNSLQPAISHFKKVFFELPHLARTQKHVSDPLKNSAAKRLNMFLRWMVRKDNVGVDFGIWRDLSPSLLSCPLDVHSGRVARKLGLLNRVQNDGKAVTELDLSLKSYDPKDPTKYDFALFGLGVFEGF